MGVPNSLLETSIVMLSAALIVLGFFFGTPLLRVLRKTYGARVFWFSGFVLATVLWFTIPPLFVLVGSIWMTLGIYMELESKGARWTVSGLVGVMIGALFFAAATAIHLSNSGIHTLAAAEGLVKEFSDKLYEANPQLHLDAGLLVQLIPSSVFTILIVSLGNGLIFEKRVFNWLKIPREKTASQLNLLEFRLPDFFVWIAMGAFLLTMVNFNLKALEILGLNIVNVMTVLYFFQGLAILEVSLRALKAGAFLRAGVYIILVGQLLPLVSAIGLIDYWVDFRKRIHNLRTAPKKN